MKLKDLKKEVCSLCFITPEEASVGFVNAVRRALSIIFCELKVTGKKTLSVVNKSICKSQTNIPHVGKKNLTLPLAGRAYSVKLSGKGCFTVRDGPIVKTQNFDTDEACFKGFIQFGGEIEFSGDYAYTVLSFVTFSDIVSDRIEDIPDDGERCIDMSKYPDFFAFVSPPTDSAKNDIRGVMTDGAKIILPPGYSGRVHVHYRKRPLPLVDDDEQIINIPDAYLPLLAPLTAALLLVDDDKELSDCYMELYGRMAEGMKASASPKEEICVRTNGWA